MTLTIATERSLVQRMCGKPDSVEVSSSDIDGIFTFEAQRWLNYRRPAVAITYFSTVANQQDYTKKPANAYHIGNVWWLTQDVEVFSPSMSYSPDSMETINAFGGFSVLNNPSIVVEFYKRISEYHHAFAGSGKETEEGKIRLIPVPGSDNDKVYFEYSYPRWNTITATPVEFIDGVRFYVASEVMRILALRRGQVTGGKNYSGGGGQNELKFMEQFLKEAEARVPMINQPFFRG